jgi:hypothetical protein
MPKCPYCGEWYKTNKGLEIHITKKHKYSDPVTDKKVLDPLTCNPLSLRRRKGDTYWFEQ